MRRISACQPGTAQAVARPPHYHTHTHTLPAHPPVERMAVALSAMLRRLRPASASSVASHSPSSSLRRRVCTLPRKLTTCGGVVRRESAHCGQGCSRLGLSKAARSLAQLALALAQLLRGVALVVGAGPTGQG